MSQTSIYTQVSTHYGAAARDNSTLTGSYGTRVATEFGYSADDLANAPEESNLGLSCGNAVALAKLKEGETVVDLGSGAGFDVFQAVKKVGSTGKAVGVDMSEDMLARANKIAKQLNHSNVSFVHSGITAIDLPANSADVVISNCVINLVPEEDKQLVFNETFRILKSGGRIAVSDILAKGDLPDVIKNSMALYVGCIAGASKVEAYERYMREAGFKDISVIDAKSDLNVYRQANGENAGCCAPSQSETSESKGSSCCGSKKESKPAQAEAVSNVDDIDFNEFTGSYKITAVKP